MTSRPHQLHLTLSKEEDAFVRKLAALRGLTVSALVRQLIRTEHAAQVRDGYIIDKRRGKAKAKRR